MRPLTLLGLGLSLCSSLHAQSSGILMDGRFDDWWPGLSTFTDNNSPASGVDLLSMQVTNDDNYLFIKLSLGSEVDLLDDLVPQTIRLYIDGDNNSATGNAAQTGYGAELQIRFDTRTVTEYWGASSNVSWSTIDLVPLPTTTGNTFEIAIARTAMPDGVNSLFTSSTIKLLFKESDGGDAMPNVGNTYSYTFDPTPVDPWVPITVGRDDAMHVRVTAWNVLNDGLTNAAQQAVYQRMLTALAPDVIGFSECVNSTAAQVKTRLDTWLPIGGSGWYVVKDDFDMVIASRWPILGTWPSLTRQFAALIDLPSTYSTDLLFTAAHLHCCTADANRQNEADEYVQFVQDAKSAGGTITVPANTPMVYAGDLNSVGYVQQLNTLLTGDIQNNGTYGPDGAMDWDGSAASQAACTQTETRMGFTWRNTSGSYPSGRLDHLFYTDAAMTCAKSFTLRTEIMPPATLSSLGLNSGDAGSASDHFAITSDFVVPQPDVAVSVKLLLEGPYDSGPGLMHDSLRAQGLLPLIEPYTALGFGPANANAAMIPALLAVTGNDALVDWVLLELRDAFVPSTVITSRSALVQRDGDVVDLDGVSPVTFDQSPGVYFVSVRHRNHFGAMTATSLVLNTTPALIDLTAPSTGVFGSNATKAVGPVQLLWTGNVVRDGQLKYTGSSNDRDPILVRIGGTVPTAVASGYLEEDVNLDGVVKYTGANNDRDPILVNVGGSVPTNTRAEQLP